jgi:hypothetical protein
LKKHAREWHFSHFSDIAKDKGLQSLLFPSETIDDFSIPDTTILTFIAARHGCPTGQSTNISPKHSILFE